MLDFVFGCVQDVFDLLLSFRFRVELDGVYYSFPYLYIFICGIAVAIIVNAFWKGVRA